MYCDYQNQKQQKATTLVGSLSRQLSEQRESIPAEVEQAYENAGNGKEPLRRTQQEEMVIRLCSYFPRTYLIIDGLDEVENTKENGREALLSSLARFWSHGIRILITSRPYPVDIRAKLNDKPRLWVAAPEDDI